ncbi:IS4 family transposase [Clostridia bacterium]|nr:IS4 family transposase [Clostridia bacterium]
MKKTQESILSAVGGRSAAKAVYRMLANPKFKLEQIEASVQKATIEAMSEQQVVLLVQDTTDIEYNGHKKTKGLGHSSEHVLGIKLHTCLAMTTEGIPLGIVRQSTSTRTKEQDKEMSPSEKSKRPITEKESYRWIEMLQESTQGKPEHVHAITVCDRECDFYEFYDEAIRTNKPFIVRLVNNRVDESGTRIKDKLGAVKAAGVIGVEIPRDSRKGVKARKAELSVYYGEYTVPKPVIRKEEYILSSVELTIIHVVEENPPEGVESVEWYLATNESVKSASDVQKIVRYYVQRWKIERFHYVLKSGCAVEAIQERSVERIVPLLHIYFVIAAYIMAMTLCGRSYPEIQCDVFFEETEWKMLYCAANKTTKTPQMPYSICDAVKYLGILGGGKRAPSDGNCGVKLIWMGLFALFILSEYVGFVGQV